MQFLTAYVQLHMKYSFAYEVQSLSVIDFIFLALVYECSLPVPSS